jgi:immune inhibitor A
MSRAFVAAVALAAAFLAFSTGATGRQPLSVKLTAAPAGAGQPIPFTGRASEPGATFRLRTVDAQGRASAPFGPFTAGPDRTVRGEVPASVTRGVRATRDANYVATYALETTDGARAGALTVSAAPDAPQLEADFVSSLGWVKPGDAYSFTLRVLNYSSTQLDGAHVTATAPDGTSFPAVDWAVESVPAAVDGRPGVRAKVVEARAATLAQDPELAWKNLSATAKLTYPGGTEQDASTNGPKVIPPTGGFDTARYGDRPFPVVPVDYSDRAHAPAATSKQLADKINDPNTEGSTYNLYQEMSYGQLFPHGTVPSESLATAGWDYAPGFKFTQPTSPCAGITNATAGDTLHHTRQPERVKNGWYQLPGDTNYYGGDGKGSALIGALTGVGALQDIDSACGPTGKAVFDAAQIADPEIDYDAYDTDKDGVVDFFMMVFAGRGGNGDSQLRGTPPYDNIWPHSSDLQNGYVDANGEQGYVSDDQSHDLEGRPLFWTDASRSEKTTNTTAFPVYTRVGPYNVNPETAITHASVISHEYGHSLGLPDYYSTGSRDTYGSWTLMATDYSQNIDVIGKKELGWVVPRVLEPGQRVASNWQDTKRDTGRIDWKRPDGTPYTLTGDGIHNGEAYSATLPGRQLIDPALVPSGTHLWWSGSGNDFGCPPTAGHNLDLALPNVPAGTKKLTLSFKSHWDVEWDFDYGFVLSTADNGKSYKSYPSAKGYTTGQAQNPNANGCQSQYGNGLTGSSGSYAAGTQTADRAIGDYPAAAFVDDEYDISDLIGRQGAALRFAYATDPGLARPGWFMDDVQIKADDQIIYTSDFETANDPALYNGGCREGLATAQRCTHGWRYVASDQDSPAEHAYLLEMRDRSGFDAHGHGESDRGDLTFQPGVLLGYTDEDHGYGNVGTADPPAQTPLDSRPEPGSDTPNLDDAAFKSGDAFSDGGAGHVDNYKDGSGNWTLKYGCLSFKVDRLGGSDIGPEPAKTYNLAGDVTFTTTAGCGAFDYGNGAVSAGQPVQPPVTPPAQERKPGAAGGTATAPAQAGATPKTTAVAACTARSVRARGPLRSFGTACPAFGTKPLTLTFRLKKDARVRVDVLRGNELVRRVLKLRSRRAARTYTLRIQPKGLAAGAYTVRLRATRAGRTTTLKLPVTRTR